MSWDEGSFPEAEQDGPPLPPDKTELVNPPANTCPTCGEVITREPGTRGRLPKYHPECRPTRKSSSVSGSPRVVRVSKNEQLAAEQTEVLIERARVALAKCVALLSLVDPYDAFVVHINSKEFLDNLRGVLMRFEWVRRNAANAQLGGDVFGLFLAVISTVLPIAAHHNLIPSKKVVKILLNMPFFMMRMQERVASGDEEEVKDELLKRVAEEGKKQREAMMRQQSEATQNGSAS